MAVKAARRTLQVAGPNDWNIPWFRLVVGFANLRDGQYSEADRYLTAAMENSTDANLRGLGLLLRSMARWRLGRVNEARQDFEGGSRGLEKEIDRTKVTHVTRHPDVLAIHLAFDEARTLLNSPVASGK